MSKPIAHIDMDAIRTLLAGQRQDIKKGWCTVAEATKILGLSKSDFYEELKSPDTLIERSKTKKGKFIMSSIKREFKRIHGVSYEYATAA